MRRGVLILMWMALCCPAWGAAEVDESCRRVVAIGDIHGGYDAFVTGLQMTGLVDEKLTWIGEDACFVQTGDVLDRGDDVRELLDLMMDLEAQAPARFHFLLGNHEVMNLNGDLRYVSRGDYAKFAAEETPAQRRKGLRDFMELPGYAELTKEKAQALFDKAFPPGWFARRAAFALRGHYGKWLMRHRAMVRIHDTLFTHGGVGPDEAAVGVKVINSTITREVRDYNHYRDRLIRVGGLNRLVPYGEVFETIRRTYQVPASQLPLNTATETLLIAQKILALQNTETVGPEGPLWSRELATADELLAEEPLKRTLGLFGVARVVVGHTPNRDGRINARFGQRVFLIDTGAGPSYKFGGIAALEIEKGGPIRAIYPDRVEEFSDAPTGKPGHNGAVANGDPDPSVEDGRTERFLLQGTVVSVEEIGSGITKPRRVTLELDGEQRRAAFKFLDDQRTGPTKFGTGRQEMNFSDRYVYERAAYLLDRELGMNMVPPSVIRRIENEPGTLVAWVEDAVDENHRVAESLKPEPSTRLTRQTDIMRMFDALIYNTDRNRGNMLYTLENWKLYLIDHSRAFRNIKKLPKNFDQRVISLPRKMHERLQGLDEKSLREVMDGLLSHVQVKALLARRDRILKKIEADRLEYGDHAVYYDGTP